MTTTTVIDDATPNERALLEVRNLVQEFPIRQPGEFHASIVHAVSDVSFDVRVGETLGIVGETGSGKSTLARALLQSPPPTSGEVRFRGENIAHAPRKVVDAARRELGMVFQDPFTSLDPKWRVINLVEEPLRSRKIGTSDSRRARAREVLDLVGIDPSVFGQRRPRQLSGGQSQRVAIARAIVTSPSLIICDEAVSSLDVLIQAQVLNLFEQLRRELGLAYLFIAHDLALVKQVSDRVAVMYLGRLCEIGPAVSMYVEPLHPYTAALLRSIPDPDRNLDEKRVRAEAVITGEPPSPIDPPSGCRFRTRCPRAQDVCAAVVPEMRELRPDHQVACHFPLTEDAPVPG